ncbi:hypothetical protein [Rhizobium sp. BK176]|uniref:hypothetical protein n=1 Tax=Rhizobium sp. BK176 TaxID=2587071 RepID=UPI002166C753|nr:hypothetical protein [Rhizobium sp. BK176]MCS4090184.1 hypothetical protein [Rhizobium sp. BK176]
MIFYHGTTTARLADILEEGLVPQVAHDNLDRTCVYLTDSLSIAELYADLAAIRRGGKAVIVEIDDRCLPSQFFAPDDYELQNGIDDLHDPERTGDVGFLTGEDVDERLRPFRRWQDVPAALCLAVTNQIAFTDTIPPTAFNNVDQLSAVELPKDLRNCSTAPRLI